MVLLKVYLNWFVIKRTLIKSVLVYQALKITWSLGCLYFNSGFRYCNIRAVFCSANINSYVYQDWYKWSTEMHSHKKRRKWDKRRGLFSPSYHSFVSEDLIKTFKATGDQFALNSGLFPLVEQFVCKLHELSQSCSTTDARYEKFCSKKESPEPQQLPPKPDALLCHLKRVDYVTAVIKKSLTPCPVTPSPCEDYGWIIKDGLLQIQWMLWKPAPDEIIELISCSCCKSKYLGNQCVCRSHGLPCTNFCNSDSCENQSEDAIII